MRLSRLPFYSLLLVLSTATAVQANDEISGEALVEAEGYGSEQENFPQAVEMPEATATTMSEIVPPQLPEVTAIRPSSASVEFSSTDNTATKTITTIEGHRGEREDLLEAVEALDTKADSEIVSPQLLVIPEVSPSSTGVEFSTTDDAATETVTTVEGNSDLLEQEIEIQHSELKVSVESEDLDLEEVEKVDGWLLAQEVEEEPQEPEEETAIETEILHLQDSLNLSSSVDSTASDENQVLVTEVAIEGSGLTPELEELIYETIKTQSGDTIDQGQIQEDINAIYDTGYFAENITAAYENSDSGVRVNFKVLANPTLQRIVIDSLPQENENRVLSRLVAYQIFAEDFDKIINLNEVRSRITEVGNWYQENGYSLAQVIGEPEISPDGTVQLNVAEGVIEDIRVRYIGHLDIDNQDRYIDPDETERFIKGQTRSFVITREIELKPGSVFNSNIATDNLMNLLSLGIFEDVSLSIMKGESPFQVILNVDILEREKYSISVGFGSSQRGVFTNSSLIDRNWYGASQEISSELQIGESHISLLTKFYSSGSPDGKYGSEPFSEAGIEAIEKSSFMKRIENFSLNLESSALQELKDSLPDPEMLLSMIELLTNTPAEQRKGNNLQSLINALLEEDNTNSVFQLTIVNEFMRALRIAENTGSQAEAALNLINLGNYLQQNKKYLKSIEKYQEVLARIEPMDSPFLESIIWIKLSRSYRGINHQEQSLESQYNALEMIQEMKSKSTWEKILGTQIRDALDEEWVFGDLNEENWQLTLNLLRNFTLLDIASTYSALGDYQQAFYIIESLQGQNNIDSSILKLKEPINSFLEVLTRSVLEMRMKSFTDEQENIFSSLALEYIERLDNEFDFIFENFSDLSQSMSSSFIYFDIGDIKLAESAHSESAQYLYGTKLFLSNAIEDAFDFIDQNREVIGIDDPVFEDILFKTVRPIIQLLISGFLDIETTENEFDVQGIFEAIHGNLSESIELNADISKAQDWIFVEDIFNSLPLLFSGKQDDNDEFIQNVIDNWPIDNKFFEDFSWAKKALYIFQASSLYNRGDYEESAELYEFALAIPQPSIDKISQSLENLLNAFGISQNQVEKISSVFKKFGSSSLERLLLDVINSGDIKNHLTVADIYYDLGNFQKSQEHYKTSISLLSLIENIHLYNIDLGALSEFYHGLARAELALGNLEEAEKANRVSRSIIDLFSLATLSDKPGLINLDFQYGYGKPKYGYLKVGLDLVPENPWTSQDLIVNIKEQNSISEISRNSSENLFSGDKKSPCHTPLDYHRCRENYYNMHVNILMDKYIKNPLFGFDQLAFESSEKARARSPQILSYLLAKNDNYTTQEHLYQRRQSFTSNYSLDAIKSELNDGTILLDYFFGAETSYLWLITKNEPIQTITLPGRLIIEEKAKEFYDLLTSPSGRVRPKTTSKVGQELSNMLLGQVADQLTDKRLLIVGDGLLQYLPFGVLPHPLLNPVVDASTENSGEFAPHLRPLLLDHEIVMLPSASALVALRENRSNKTQPSQELAIFADPVFSHKDERVETVSIGAGFDSLTQTDLDEVDIIYSSLPYTAEERSQIEQLVPSDQRQSFSGFDASLENALAPELGDFRVIHFASHGIFNSQSPDRSGVVLSSINENGELQPGLLSPSDAFGQMNLLGTDLVVLSGCRTGFGGGLVNREGLTGFTGGLLSAGADRVITSLWSVQDDATQELMTRFYARYLNTEEPRTAAQALREAQISMWNEPQWQTPYYWAAFILQGEWQ
ncbi:MAG: CHAT domain-containing protein [Spirulina sp. SIO3F2]|nr:CHAT domain-containing protein [Spirulina sp. SIO3F2]